MPQIKNYSFLINLLRKLHTIVILFWFISIYLMFFTERFKLLGIFYLVLVGFANFTGRCPLTLLEERLLDLSGCNEKVKNFTPIFLKKHGIKIPYKLALIAIAFSSILALFYLVRDVLI